MAPCSQKTCAEKRKIHEHMWFTVFVHVRDAVNLERGHLIAPFASSKARDIFKLDFASQRRKNRSSVARW